MVYIIYLLIMGSIFIIVSSLLGPVIDKQVVATRLPSPVSRSVLVFKNTLKPVMTMLQRLLQRVKIYENMKRLLNAAHIKLLPEYFFIIKALSILALFVLVKFVFGRLDILKGIIIFILAYLLPDFIVRRIIAKRKEAIARVLPETIDLIGLCVEAGLDFTSAVRWIVEKTRPNPLTEELAFVVEEIRWGKSRSQALKDMSKRLNMRQVSSFVQYIVQAERMGTPVSETFTSLSEDTRLQRFEQGERQALKAPIKILFPLLFCILPVIGIIIMGPVFLQFLGQKSLLKF